MRGWVVAALVVLYAVPVGAETPHRVALSVYIASAAADYHSTHLVLSRPDGYERNPLGRLTDGRPTATIAIGMAVDAAATTLLYRWLGKKHPTLTTVMLYTASSVRITLAIHNYRAAKRPLP